ncbi:GNAT family N-acetyltransferase [Thalassoglobus polymorphus]|uniref:BioF2-like acetyltransferase domain-containing protein n=1 Tax=Thalassoglobus polymorphus TaxID=2527994 RepID=A0A517QUB0_9PLAN|nr:GNAT family N-acetyltransferase [Thalassoglobus polymorphus]QDT35229.1 hypothetical protein Mal48_45050 [Thalassoglobus polymorphus]
MSEVQFACSTEETHQVGKPQAPSFTGPFTTEGGLTAITLSSPSEMDQWIGEWIELAQQTEFCNAFYEPTFFQAAVKNLASQEDWQVVLIKEDAEDKLIGFFPFVRGRGPARLSELSLWKSKLSFLTSPLIRSGSEQQVFKLLLKHLRTMQPRVDLVELPMTLAEGRVHQELHRLIRDNLLTTYHYDHYSRAILTEGHDYDELLTENIGRHHFREYRRQLRRMNNLGQVEFRTNEDPEYGECWADWFLELELKSWKGEGGSALKQDPQQEEFFRELVTSRTRAGGVEMLGMFLDGEPVAMLCTLVSQKGCFEYKIAFDQEYKKYSPGMLVQLHKMQRFLESKRSPWVDSCAVPNHPMINRLWSERRSIEHMVVSLGRPWANIVLGAMPLLRSLKRTFRKPKR